MIRPASAAVRLAPTLALLLTACAAEPTRLAEGPRGGIGGTGRPLPAPDAGIFGTVTSFGSIRVNGLVVEVSGRKAASPLGPVLLAEGHVVEVLADVTADGLEARALSAVAPLAGPLTAPPRPDRLEVMGADVRIEPGAPVPDDLAAGERVAVYGLWQGETLVASRVDRLASDAPDAVVGLAAPGRLGPVVLAPDAGAAGLEGPPDGRRVLALGAWTPQGFQVERHTSDRVLLAAPLRDLSVEGYLAERDGRLMLSGFDAPLDAVSSRLDALRSGRAVFVGSWDGAFRLRHGVPLPEGSWARAYALDRIGDGFAPARGAVPVR